MNELLPKRINWIGAGLSLVWIGFFFACMFIRTNLPETSFAVRFLEESRVLWTLGGSFFALLTLSIVISALVARIERKNRERSDRTEP